MRRIYGRYYAIILFFLISVASSEEGMDDRKILEEWMKVRTSTNAEQVKFFHSLNPSDLLKFGHDAGKWVEQNPQGYIDAGSEMLMFMIIENYVRQTSYKPEREKIQSIITSSSEPWLWRSMWIVWLRERTYEEPNLYKYFPKELESFFDTFNTLISNKSDNIYVRRSAINASSRLLKSGITAYQREEKWCNETQAEFLYSQTKEEIKILAGILNNPEEDISVLQETLKALGYIISYTKIPESESIKRTVKNAFRMRKQYKPEFQITLANWLLNKDEDISIEKEVQLMKEEYPFLEQEITDILKKIQAVKNSAHK